MKSDATPHVQYLYINEKALLHVQSLHFPQYFAYEPFLGSQGYFKRILGRDFVKAQRLCQEKTLYFEIHGLFKDFTHFQGFFKFYSKPAFVLSLLIKYLDYTAITEMYILLFCC